MDDFLANLLAHRLGVFILKKLSGGRFQGESGFAWGWALVVGGFALFAPCVALLAWVIHANSS